MKVVLDANILVSFLLTSGSTLTKILFSWRQKQFTVLLTEEILLEIKEVVARFVARGLVSRNAAMALVRRLQEEGEIVFSLSQVTLSPHKKDNRYLACAKDGEAAYLVTGDKKHLLALKKFGKTKIVSPWEFLKILEERNQK